MDTALAARVVDRLVHEGLLDPAAADRSRAVVTDVLAPRAQSGGLPKVVEVVAYLGGALVLAAGSLFVWQEWSDLGFGAQVAVLAVVSLVLAVAGAVVARRRHDVRRRLAGALLVGCSIAVATLVGYVLDRELRPSWDDVPWPLIAGAAAGAVVAVVAQRIAPTALGVAALLGYVLTATSGVLDALPASLPGSEGDLYGVVFLAIGAAWLALTELGALGERAVPRALGAATALVGAQIPVLDGTHSGFGYLLTVLVAAAGVAAYLRLQAWPYLAAAVLGVTLVVPEAITDWTDDSLGAVGGVLVAGVTLLLASAAGYRLRAETLDTP